MEKVSRFVQWIRRMPKRYWGVGIAVFLWILLKIFGFFPTLLLVALIIVGYEVGKIFDKRENWQDVVERFWQSDRYDP